MEMAGEGGEAAGVGAGEMEKLQQAVDAARDIAAEEEKASRTPDEFEKMQQLQRSLRAKEAEKEEQLQENGSKIRSSSGTTVVIPATASDASGAAATALLLPEAVESKRNNGNDGAESSQRNISRLLHLTCKFDSTPSLSSLLDEIHIDALDNSGLTPLHHAAEHHSVKCIELLLKRRAKTDIKSATGLNALEIALRSERMQMLNWSPDQKVSELLTLIGDKDLAAIKILAAHTRDVAQVASRLIVHGNIVAFAALLSVTGDALINAAVHRNEDHVDGTLLDIVLQKVTSAGEQVEDNVRATDDRTTADVNFNLRQTLLQELELYLRWYLLNHDHSDGNRRTPPTVNVHSPLVRAAQAGDAAVLDILIDHGVDVNETDSGGNTALHWSVRTSVNAKDIRFVIKLIRHGASVTMGNRLGLTPVHIAAGQGHVHALQILLAVEPSSVHVTAETKETPLFSAVKGNHYDCVQVLLQHGASRQVLNLRKQRPIDVAVTTDMRALLSLQESTGRTKDVNPIRPNPTLFDVDCGRLVYEAEHMRLQSETSQALEYPDESLKPPLPGKTEMCRYFSMPGGCVRGDKCYYAHKEEELQGRGRAPLGQQGMISFNPVIAPTRAAKRSSEDLSKKIFVGGLSPSVESDDLREFFEGKFGAVMDAVVIGNHAGNHVQSRGFGFVTFKHEESVMAAVQAHYVNIFGKKVEIKGAVPRSMFPSLDGAKGSLDVSRPSSATSSRISDMDGSKLPDAESQQQQICQSGGDQAPMLTYMGYQGDSSVVPYNGSINDESYSTQGASSSVSPRSICPTPQDTTWIAKFKQWLPKFLAEVSNRLKEGEWYPLSSLKGDFRATCGLELDHVSIGYHKLSDFVRSIPESCRMKIVPVGRGPATHMVLLPALPRMTPTLTASGGSAKSTVTGFTSSSSLVDAGRTYAAAACQQPYKSTMESPVPSRVLRPQATLTGNTESPFESRSVPTSIPQNVFNNNPVTSGSRFKSDCPRLPEAYLSNNHITADAGAEDALHAPLSKEGARTPGPLIQGTDASTLKDLLTLMDNCEGQRESRVAAQGLPYPANNNISGFVPNCMLQARNGVPGTNTSPMGEQHTESHLEEPKTPAQQSSSRPFSTFNHPFSGFMPQEYMNSGYNMWGQPLGHINPALMSRNVSQQRMGAKSSDQKRSWEDSPQSVLQPYGRAYSQSPYGMHEAPPRSVFSPPGNSPSENHTWGPLCACCCVRPSMWLTIPCNHLALCAACKDFFHKHNRSLANCPECGLLVERWIALH